MLQRYYPFSRRSPELIADSLLSVDVISRTEWWSDWSLNDLLILSPGRYDS